MIGEATTGLLGNSGKLRPIHGNYLSNFLHTLYIYFSKEHGRCMYYDRLNNTYIHTNIEYIYGEVTHLVKGKDR